MGRLKSGFFFVKVVKLSRWSHFKDPLYDEIKFLNKIKYFSDQPTLIIETRDTEFFFQLNR